MFMFMSSSLESGLPLNVQSALALLCTVTVPLSREVPTSYRTQSICENKEKDAGGIGQSKDVYSSEGYAEEVS